MTLSRAMSGSLSVAPETRRRILSVAKQVGYYPRPNIGRPRRDSRKGRATAEMIMGTPYNSEFCLAMMGVIEQELAARNFDCVIRTTDGRFEPFVQLCHSLRASSDLPTLVIGYLPAREIEILLKARPRAILVDHTGDPELAVPYRSIGFDNTEAARQVVRHLLATGRRRILLITGFGGHYFRREIEQGYREALAGAGVTARPEWVLETDFSMEQAAAAVTKAVNDGTRFDAVFTNDTMAVAVLWALEKHGLRVPADVAVAGCDGLPIGQYTKPSLTTARLDYAQLGRVVIQQMFDAQESDTLTRTRLLPELIIRDSTKEKQDGVPRPGGE
jgi:LacI family transcriptional regulator